MEKEVQEIIPISSNEVTLFLARGIVKTVRDNKSLEIEAKIKKQKGYQNKYISEEWFLNSEHQMRLMTTNMITKNSNQEKESMQVQSQFLLSFSFESGHRFTFDVSKKSFILEIKENNSDSNTLRVLCQDIELNISRKQETQVQDQQMIREYLEKLKNNKYNTIRIKVRRTYTKEFTQSCFSQVIQIKNEYFHNSTNPTEKQLYQKDILVKVYCFLENYFSNKPFGIQINNIFSSCFEKRQHSTIGYEIEVEMVSLSKYFETLVKDQNIKQIKALIPKFYDTINFIISSFNKSRHKHPVILGGYIC